MTPDGDRWARLARARVGRSKVGRAREGRLLTGRLADRATLLATHRNGGPLTRAHGGPVRLVVPRLHLRKSAKWIRRIWPTDAGNVGYWEARGCHRRGDPSAEERYGR